MQIIQHYPHEKQIIIADADFSRIGYCCILWFNILTTRQHDLFVFIFIHFKFHSTNISTSQLGIQHNLFTEQRDAINMFLLTPTAIIFANQYKTILPFKLWFVFYGFYVQFILFPTISLIVWYAHQIYNTTHCQLCTFCFINAFLNCRPHKFPFYIFYSQFLPCNAFQHTDLYRYIQTRTSQHPYSDLGWCMEMWILFWM